MKKLLKTIKNIKHEKYFDVLFSKKIMRHNMKRIQSKLHKIGTYDVSKISLPCFDDKIFILDDGINTTWLIFIKIEEVNKTR